MRVLIFSNLLIFLLTRTQTKNFELEVGAKKI